MTRRPAVAGMFYEADRGGLVRSIEECFVGKFGPGRLPKVAEHRSGRVVGLVCPHAGYVYSGGAAAHAYNALAEDGLPDIAVIIGPNHHALGAAVAISPDAEWTTPLGTLSVDAEVVEAILRLSTFAKKDDRAHLKEHSLEVQAPFLQYIGGSGIKLVPITIAHLSKAEALILITDLGAAIATALDGKSAVIIASTDFTHYESKASAEAKDALAMDHILDLDAEGLLHTVYDHGITMCGVVGTSVMLDAAKRLGATHARKLAYYTSGDVTGDAGQVVGYGAAVVEL